MKKSAFAVRAFARREAAFSSADFAFNALLKIARISESESSKVFIALFFTGNRPGPSGYFLNPIQRYDNFSNFQKFFLYFSQKCAFFLLLVQENVPIAVYLHRTTPKNQPLCLFKKFPAAIVGANPERFTRPKHKRKRKAAPRTHPDTGKSPRKAKRNRVLPVLPIFPYLCRVFLPRIALSVT